MEISDEEEEVAAMAWSPERKHQVAVVRKAPLYGDVSHTIGDTMTHLLPDLVLLTTPGCRP